MKGIARETSLLEEKENKIKVLKYKIETTCNKNVTKT